MALGCCAGDDSLVNAFFADRGCLTGQATNSSSSDACGVCRFPLDRDDLVLCLVDILFTEVDFLFAEVAEDGFWAEVHAMIMYFGRRNVW